MTASRLVSSRLDKRNKFEGRTKDRIGKTKNGFSRFAYQQKRGKTFNSAAFNSKLNVRKNILKPQRRVNLSIMNRRYYNRNNNNSFYSRNRRKGNTYENRLGNANSNRRGDFSSRKNGNKFGNSKRNNFRSGFRNNRRRNFGNRRMNYKNVHAKVGKLSSKDLDAELDNYMGANNVKSRLDTDLDNYFKNNTSKQMESNK